MPRQKAEPVSAAEARELFAGLEDLPALLLAVSGGPDSTALMVLAARWRSARKRGPKLTAVTVDHGLRAQSRHEAAAVARLARQLGLTHRTMRWRGRKPKAGLQEAARLARYRLLAEAARAAGAAHVLTAHTLDDQAETVLIRMSRGSGLHGLAAMQRVSVIPRGERYSPTVGSSRRCGMTGGEDTLLLVRPLLDIAKLRLVATLHAGKISYAEDASNRDPRFTRARLRKLMPALAEEGLTASRFAQLARRLRRADQALETMVDASSAALVRGSGNGLAIEAAAFAQLSAEIGLRLLARMLARTGEGPVKLGKLEKLREELDAALGADGTRFRRSLAGALVTLRRGDIVIERAPPRRRKIASSKKRFATSRLSR